jgi:hypothetical protein
MTITGDSASSNIKGVRQLEELFGSDPEFNGSTDNPTWAAMENFLSCASHVINLVAKDVCAPFISKINIDGQEVIVDACTAESRSIQPSKKKGVMVNALAKLGGAAKKRNQSTHFTQSWNSAATALGIQPLKLLKAAPTRWNSRYAQIDVALKMRAVYEKVTSQNEHRHFQLSENEWDHLTWLYRILGHLNLASQKLSASKTVTISEMLPIFNKLWDLLEDELELSEDLSGKDNAYERQERRRGLQLARDKLAKYYAHTESNPWYTFGLSKSHLSFPRPQIQNRYWLSPYFFQECIKSIPILNSGLSLV